MYRHVFRDGLVDGRVLLGITDVMLEQNKVTNILHRQSILFAIQNLREASEALISGRTDSIGEVLAHHHQICQIFKNIVFLFSNSANKVLNTILGNHVVGWICFVRHFHFVSPKRRLRNSPAAKSYIQKYGVGSFYKRTQH
jgi:hypothetical protein